MLSGANDEDRKVFTIGINCDADTYYNKDAKEPNKYEQEGQKGQFDSAATMEYYAKLLREHPLVTYLEDAFAQLDFVGHRLLQEAIKNEFSNVKMGLKKLFSTDKIERFRDVTTVLEFTEEQLEEMRLRREEREKL